MSTVSDARVAGPSRHLLYRHFNRLLEETSRLSEMELEALRYHSEFAQRVQAGTKAAGVALWGRAESGAIQLEYQINLNQVGLDNDRASHDAMLGQAFNSDRPLALAPHSGPESAPAAASNPTDHAVLLAPILVDKQVVGIVEVWQEAGHSSDLQAAFVQFLVGMAHYASIYYRNRQLRRMAGQQQLWLRMEAFSRQVHASLDLGAVACTIANEGRQLIECDRISVARRQGSAAVVEAISGVDVIEKHASQVRLLGRLCTTVLKWGERLEYRGVPDESLPPEVWQALDAYLAQSNSKLLVVQPLGEDDEKRQRGRFALVLECFDPTAAPEQLLARLEVVARHARGALANAALYRGIPLRWLWQPLGWLQEGLGGGARATALLVAVLLAAVGTALVCVPCPLKMAANGQLLPRERRWVYAPVEGQVVRFEPGVQPGSFVSRDQSLVLLYDTQLELKMVQLVNEIAGAQEEIGSLAQQQQSARTEAERVGFGAEKKQKEFLRNRKQAELKALRERTHSDDSRPGYFWLKAPLAGTVLNWDFRERLTHRTVRPSEPLVRIGDKDAAWEIELKIPHQHLGQVLAAFPAPPSAHHGKGGMGGELDVDLLLASAPTRTFKGKLARTQLAGEASTDPDSEASEPVVRASVRIDGPGIPESEQIPRELLVAGGEVHARIRCGPRPAIYTLFHGVWEFFYEKVLFF